MCGFVCVIKRGLQHHSQKTIISENILKHRGPDYTDEVVFNNVAIRHWRLSIIDLSNHSNQPIVDQGDIFAYNGELYDYIELGAKFGVIEQGDTRTFFSLLRKNGGYEAIQKASGFYSFLLYSKSSNQVFGARDRFGKKPLFIYKDSNIAVFSSEERGILPFLSSKELNSKVLGEYLLYKNKFFGQSYFKGIHEIAPGASFQFDIDKWNLTESYGWQQYYSQNLGEWFLPDTIANSNENFSHSLKREFKAAVKRRIKCDVPIQIALSGGVDSASVAAIAMFAESSDNVLRALTVGFKQGLDESDRARLTAKLLNLPHHVVVFNADDFIGLLESAVEAMSGPLDHPHALAYYLMCHEVKKYGKALLTGEGADELFFGYSHYEEYKGNSFAFREYLQCEDELCFKSSGYSAAFDQIRNNSGLEVLRSTAVASPYMSRDLEIKTHLNSLLQRNDRMSMANSVEIRAPFLDPSLITLALATDQKKLQQEGKNCVREIVSDLIPDLPQFGKKNGFRIPFDENFDSLQNTEKGQYWLDLGITALDEHVGIIYNSEKPLPTRLGWSLLNIGCFIDKFELH